MIDKIKRMREPLTWTVIALVAANLVLGVVRLVLLLTLEKVPVFAAFQEIGLSLMNLSLVLALVGLVCTCLFVAPATPRAPLVTRVAAWVLTIGVALTLVCMVLGVAASANAFAVALEIFGGLLDVIIKALAAGSLWVLTRGVGAGRIDTAPQAEVESAVQSPATEVPPVWKREEAAGSAWRTADEAATGSPGTVAGGPASQGPGPDVTGSATWRPVERGSGSGDGNAQGLTKPE